MEITEVSLKKIGFVGYWYPGEGWCGKHKSGLSIIFPHNILNFQNGEKVIINNLEELISIIKKYD